MSNLVMVFDTETTNKTDFKAPWDDPCQPDLVQLGYKVWDPISREVMFEIGHLVDTTAFPSFNMSPEAQAVHGISPESAKEYGWDIEATVQLFMTWLSKSKLHIAHNADFDIRVMQCFLKRSGFNPDVFSQERTYCTMKSTTNICKIPKKNGYGNKWPSLDECFKFFVDPQGFKAAHNALADVNACGDIFWKLVDKEFVTL